MYGDLSRNSFDHKANVDGVLHQQGRVLTDADWNEQTLIGDRWQRAAAGAAISGGFAAVGSGDPNALLVVQGSVADGRIAVDVNPGQVWAGGWLAHLRSSTGNESVPERRQTSYLRAPSGPAPGSPGTRDAVVIELWREALSAFQVPHSLIEPALGGVDTTERMLARPRLPPSAARRRARAATRSAPGSRTTARRACGSRRAWRPPSSPTATAPSSRAAATAGSSTTSTASRSPM